MPPKSDAQKQVSKERLLATLKGASVYPSVSSYMPLMISLLSEATPKQLYNTPIGKGYGLTQLAGGLIGAYKGYKASSPFLKKEDKQLEEVFEDKQVHSGDITRPRGRWYSGESKNIPEALKDFFEKLEGAGYEVPKVASAGSSKSALPLGAFGGYSPNAKIGSTEPSKGLYFRDEPPSSKQMGHELTHYLENVAGGGKNYLSELIQQEGGVEAAGSKFGERMYPEQEGYARDIKEMVARIAGDPGAYNLEERLIGQTRKSVEDITDTPSGLLGSPQTTGTQKDITEIIKDIESYHKLSQQSQNLWQNLPFEAQLKSDALSKILSGKEDLSKADKQSLQYIETGLPFLKEKGYIWR